MRAASYSRAELLYWHAIAEYRKGHHDGEFQDRVSTDLRQCYPDSVWIHRVPEYLTDAASVR